ncbi:MAG TPA: carboxylating nicotinate-nucleotide diphosphorylase [Pirellulaceae bacterium]|nr:carboxylating nicotinate-nucleotide diphosphorylase [Pirellulaceae bacterium]
MKRDYRQIEWDESVAYAAHALIRFALAEDLGEWGDVTAQATIPKEAIGSARLVARQPGVLAGLPVARHVLAAMNVPFQWTACAEEGAPIERGTLLAEMSGGVRDLLVAERTMLNLLSRLCGVATLTRRYVDAAAGGKARIYDTRKTTPGWRLLEKYAVAKGGGRNHRLGLYDSILIKDNHLAAIGGDDPGMAVGMALRAANESLASFPAERREHALVEIEVDTFQQLQAALEAGGVDVILLDNMDDEQLRRAAELRDQVAADVELEASGGMTLDRIPSAARTGVDRISVGALTHQAVSLDIGLDWGA